MKNDGYFSFKTTSFKSVFSARSLLSLNKESSCYIRSKTATILKVVVLFFSINNLKKITVIH